MPPITAFAARTPRRPSATAIALFAALALFACASHPHTVPTTAERPSLHEADVAMASGSPRVALQIARAVLADAPDDVAALDHAGDAAAALGQRDAAGEYTAAP